MRGLHRKRRPLFTTGIFPRSPLKCSTWKRRGRIRELRSSVNKGRPPIAATSRPGAFTEPGVMHARKRVITILPAPKIPRDILAAPFIPKELPANSHCDGAQHRQPKTRQEISAGAAEALHQQDQERQQLQQKQEQEHQRYAQQQASRSRCGRWSSSTNSRRSKWRSATTSSRYKCRSISSRGEGFAAPENHSPA